MPTVDVRFTDPSVQLACGSLTGTERLGDPARFELTAFSKDPVPTSLLGEPCAIHLQTNHGERIIFGIVTTFVSIGTAQAAGGRIYRLTIQSALATVDLRRRCRVFQHVTVPAIIQDVAAEAGYSADRFELRTQAQHAPREYVVQYMETDLAVLRRLCEEEGLYFRFAPGDGADIFVLKDTSSTAPPGVPDPITLVDDTGLHHAGLSAFRCRSTLIRRPGKVTLRDYDPEHPSVALEGTVSAGTPTETDVEVYAAPGRFKTPADGKQRAALHLEALRAEARAFTFLTSATELAPGVSFNMEMAPDYPGTARPDGKHLVVALSHTWQLEGDRYELEVEAIPLDVPFRLPRITHRPHIAGIHSAIVTGAPGEEIHPDEHCRIRVRFHWDRSGPTDHGSSLPVRVAQPNTPGSMVIPRVGWEVFVVFEDGDPDRPYVIGRTYNAKQPPPFSLPANKTVTSLATFTSPGGGKQNSIHFDDAAGRQHVAIHAASAKSTTVASNLFTQTAKVEKHGVGGSQTRTIGGTEAVSVKQAYFVSVGSQTASVGGTQKVFVNGNHAVNVGSETVSIGAALIENVGNPASGALNLAKAGLLAGAGALGTVGKVFAAAAPIVQAGIQGAQQGGAAGAAKGVGMGLLSMVAGSVPFGDDVMAAVTSAAGPAPWKESHEARGAVAAGGGAGGGASDASGAAGPGPGHRNTEVNGGLMEVIGALYGITTPGSISWSTKGAATYLVSASHSTKTASAAVSVLGGAKENLGSLRIKSGGILSRGVKGALNTTNRGRADEQSGRQTRHRRRRAAQDEDRWGAHDDGWPRHVPVRRRGGGRLARRRLDQGRHHHNRRRFEAVGQSHALMKLAVVGMGLVSPAGLTAQDHAFFIRAGVPPPIASPFLGADDKPIAVRYCPWIPATVPVRQRMSQMASTAVDEAHVPLTESFASTRKSRIVVCLPPAVPPDDREALARGIAGRAAGARTQTMADGAAAFVALREADEVLSRGDAQVVTLVAVDSFVGVERLTGLLEHPPSPWRRAPPPPSEGSAAVVLMTPTQAKQSNVPVLGIIDHVAYAKGTASDENDEIVDGEPMGTLLWDLLKSDPILSAFGQSDLDALREREWQIATARNAARFDPACAFVCVESAIGSIGTAAGLFQLAYALACLRHDTLASPRARGAPFVTWAISREGTRSLAAGRAEV